jgi:uncharacterized membrane protein YkvA (DUF1232 family)
MARPMPDIEILPPEREEPGGRAREEAVRARFWPAVKGWLARIPFIDEVVAGYFAMIDPKTPAAARLTLLAAFAYVLLPHPPLKRALAGLGFLDNATALAAGLAAVGAAIRDEHRAAARRALHGDRAGGRA